MIWVSDGNFCYLYLVLGFCLSSVDTLMRRSENEQAQLLSNASSEFLLSSFCLAILLLAVWAFTALLRMLALSLLPFSFLTEMWTQALLPANIWEQSCIYPASCILDVTWDAGDVIAFGELCDLGMRFWQVSKGGEEYFLYVSVLQKAYKHTYKSSSVNPKSSQDVFQAFLVDP